MNDIKKSILALSKVIENIANDIDSDSNLGDVVDRVANLTEVALDELYYMAVCAEDLDDDQ
jgi:hypothetical protein